MLRILFEIARLDIRNSMNRSHNMNVGFGTPHMLNTLKFGLYTFSGVRGQFDMKTYKNGVGYF